jgi:hypothetical protein
MSDEIIIKVPFPTDDDGMIGRECPNPECQRYFKIKPGTGITNTGLQSMFCPYCESQYPENDFLTQDQLKLMESHFQQFAHKLIEDLFTGIVRSQSRPRSSKSFVTLKWHYKPGTPPSIYEYVEKELQTTIVCMKCGLQYAVWGVFAVCPDCGQHNLFQTAEANLNMIKHQIKLKENLQAEFGKSHAEFMQSVVADLAPKWIENAYEDLVTTFETFCKELDRLLLPKAANPEKKKHGNIFQRLNDAHDWFQKQYNFDLSGTVKTAEIDQLRLVFSKRHLLAHNMGIIDQRYIDQNDLSDNILGHKVEVSENEIEQAVEIVQKIFQHSQTVVD